MKKELKANLIILGVVILVLAILFFPETKTESTEFEVVKCIGEKSILYSQLGCSHCKTQKELFGENTELLNEIDCFYESDKCSGIKGTPSWEIKGEVFTGVYEIEQLKDLTGC